MSEPTTKEAFSAIIKAEDTEGMINWSDERRTEFVNTFEKRARVARYLMLKTAELIWEKAKNRRFVSDKHEAKLLGVEAKGWRHKSHGLMNSSNIHDAKSDYSQASTVGGRQVDELGGI